VNPDAIERATERLEAARSGAGPAATAAALDRARAQVEALAETAAELQATMPGRVGDAIRDGIRSEAAPVGRHLAEVRGLSVQAIRRLERIEGDLAAERHARVDDLALLVDLVSSGWRNVAERLERLEEALGSAVPNRDGGTLRAV
jgi:hypothetical protein